MVEENSLLDAIIFDFDGVLVDSVPVKTESFPALYESYGAEIQRQVVEYHLQHKGISREKKFLYYQQKLVAGKTDDDTLGFLAQRFAELVKTRVIACSQICGSEAVLQRFNNVVPMYVASGTPETELREIISARGMELYFRGVYGSPASKAAIVANIIEAGNFDARRCVMVGDAIADFNAAFENKTRFVGVGPLGDTEFPADTVVVPNLTKFVDSVAMMFNTSPERLIGP